MTCRGFLPLTAFFSGAHDSLDGNGTDQASVWGMSHTPRNDTQNWIDDGEPTSIVRTMDAMGGASRSTTPLQNCSSYDLDRVSGGAGVQGSKGVS